jgi:YD repeat-containing protein
MQAETDLTARLRFPDGTPRILRVCRLHLGGCLGFDGRRIGLRAIAVTGRHTDTTASHNGVTSTDTDYTYDELGRLTQVAATFFNGTGGSTTSTTAYDYLVSGQLLAEATNGTTTSRRYDPLGRLLGQETVSSAGALATFDYFLDKAGHRLRIDEMIDPDPPGRLFV